jgi:hypothetical protein
LLKSSEKRTENTTFYGKCPRKWREGAVTGKESVENTPYSPYCCSIQNEIYTYRIGVKIREIASYCTVL